MGKSGFPADSSLPCRPSLFSSSWNMWSAGICEDESHEQRVMGQRDSLISCYVKSKAATVAGSVTSL